MKGYQLLELLSRGHACDTYDAWSEERGCRVIIRTGDVRREGRLLQRLTHPNIVRAYEVHRDWIVLETLSGATLAALLEDGPLDHDDAAEMGRQLCSAIGYLHRRGRLHFDLKPSNLIADGGRLKVIDVSARRSGRAAECRRPRAVAGPRANGNCGWVRKRVSRPRRWSWRVPPGGVVTFRSLRPVTTHTRPGAPPTRPTRPLKSRS
jgi:eukaryotic-like serine/threonine-protein kinase